MNIKEDNELVKQRMKQLIQSMVDDGFADPKLLSDPISLFLIRELARTQLELGRLKRQVDFHQETFDFNGKPFNE